jgi:hypothetical protein
MMSPAVDAARRILIICIRLDTRTLLKQISSFELISKRLLNTAILKESPQINSESWQLVYKWS